MRSCWPNMPPCGRTTNVAPSSWPRWAPSIRRSNNSAGCWKSCASASSRRNSGRRCRSRSSGWKNNGRASSMGEVMLAIARTFGSLRQGKVWFYVLVPALLSLVFSIFLAIWALGAVVQQMLAYPPFTWLAGWGLLWLAHILAYLGGWMAIFAIAYLTASLLAAIVIMPLLLRHLSQGEYRDVAAMGKDSFVAAAANSLWAALVFVAGWLL